MGTEEPPVRITAEEEIQAPLNQLPPNKALRATSPVILADIHGYEVRPRNDKRGVDLISDALPFGRLLYEDASAAVDYAKHSSRSHDAVIHVYDEADAKSSGRGRAWGHNGCTATAGLSKRVRPDDALRQFGMRNGVRRLAWSPMCHESPKEWG